MAFSSQGPSLEQHGPPQEGDLNFRRAELEATPPRVRRHYIKVLLDWTVSTLLRGAPLQHSSARGDARVEGAVAKPTAEAAVEDSPTRVAARLWALLAALLRMREVGPGTAASPALVIAAAGACRVAAQAALHTLGDDVSADLAESLLDVLRLLAAKERLLFSPSLEHSVAFAEAAVEAQAAIRGAAAAGPEAWTEVCIQGLAMLRSVCLSHPNQRKVYVAVVERLFIPLLACIGPPGSDSSNSQRRLMAASRQLLDAAIFHRVHIEGLAAIASSHIGSKGPETAKEVHGPEQGNDDGAPEEDRGRSQAATYLGLLFKELSREGGEASSQRLEALLAGLPWLLARFKAALKRQAKATASDARDAAEQGRGQAREGAHKGGAAASADFGFFALLLQPVLARLESAAQESQLDGVEKSQQTPSGQPLRKRAAPEQAKRSGKKKKLQDGTAQKHRSGESAWPILAEGAAVLVGTLKSEGVYRATEDVTGAHQRLLSRLGTAVLLPFEALSYTRNNERAPACESVVRKAAAATSVLGAIMDVEHRALHGRLESLWEVLWTSASQATPAGTGGVSKAAEVAGRLVRAYGELRQVELLLRSLTAALGATCALAAAGVIGSTAFKSALHQTVYEAPPGQKPKIVAFAAAGVQQLLAAEGGIAPALAVLLRGCLAGVRIDLTTSPAVASALEHLISRSLAPPLASHLLRAADGGDARASRPQLAALLQLYALATGAHAACAALQPQIIALPGQAPVLGVHAGEQGAEGPLALGYFDALRTASSAADQHSPPALPTLLSLSRFADPGSEGDPLQEPLVACMLQRAHVLHERLLHLRFSCPIQQEPPAGAADPSAPPASVNPGSTPPLDTSEIEAETGGELRALADSLVETAASAQKAADGEPTAAGVAAKLQVTEGLSCRQQVLQSAGLLLQHASSSQRACLLRLLLLRGVPTEPRAHDKPPGASMAEKRGSIGVFQLHSTAILEEADLDSEWLHAIASIVHDSLAAAFATLLDRGSDAVKHNMAAAAPSRPKRKGKRVGSAGVVAQGQQGSQVKDKLWGLIRSIGILASPTEEEAPFDGASGCEALLDALQGCTSQALSAPCGATGDVAHDSDAARALRQTACLFSQLAALPPQWFAARSHAAAQLVSLALLTQAALLPLVCSQQPSAELGVDWSPSRNGLCALQAAHGFVAAAARSGSRHVLGVLSRLAHARLDWPFVVAGLAASAADAAGTAGGASWRASSAHSMLRSSAAIMGSVVRHGLVRGGMDLTDTSRLDVTADGAVAADKEAALKTISMVEAFLEDVAGRMTAIVTGKVSGELQTALQLQTLTASVVSSMAVAASDFKRKAASSICAGPAGRSNGVLEAAELRGVLDSLEALCVHCLEAASKQVFAGHHREQKEGDVATLLQQSPERTMCRDWQRPEEAAAVASLLGAAAVLLDTHRRSTAGTSSGSTAHADSPAGAATQRALIRHLGRHLHLASTFLLAPWRLQDQDGGSAKEATTAGGLPLEAALDVVAYLTAAARALPAGQEDLPGDIIPRMLALHMHLLCHLLPLPPVPGPKRRLSMGLLMSVPTLTDDGWNNSHRTPRAHSILREAILISVREIVHASSLAEQEQLYHSVHSMLLDQGRSLEMALPVLEVLLVAMESVHSAAALRVLSQSSEGLAAAIISCCSQASLIGPGAAAASVCMALRCLESLVARDTAVKLPGYVVSQALQVPALLFPPTIAAQTLPHRGTSSSAGVFAACCHLLVAAVRHRTMEVRRCMALVAAAARALLTWLQSWRPAGSGDLARQCAEDLGNVYEAIAEHKEMLGMYCHHIVADYITLAAAPATPHGAAEDDCAGGRAGTGRWPGAAAALRPGAYALYGACSAAQVQHVFAVLHRTGGGTRRTAMTQLRQDYERNLKFSGKV